ncbi:MAG: hypothetical protein ACE5NP_09380, partial [Anaerolineae bacterium]
VTRFKGQTVRVYFNVYNDGVGGRTAMYVDEVGLIICPPGVPTPTPTATATPTLTPTATPTPTLPPDTRLETRAERIPVILSVVIARHGIFLKELILTMIHAEAGRDLNNEVNEDGLMQVTVASGHHHKSGLYTNTPAGIDAAIKDGLTVLKGFYDRLGRGDQVRAAWHYNGGNKPYLIYDRGLGNPNYLGALANRLERYVPLLFGEEYASPDLVRRLRDAQRQVDSRTY